MECGLPLGVLLGHHRVPELVHQARHPHPHGPTDPSTGDRCDAGAEGERSGGGAVGGGEVPWTGIWGMGRAGPVVVGLAGAGGPLAQEEGVARDGWVRTVPPSLERGIKKRGMHGGGNPANSTLRWEGLGSWVFPSTTIPSLPVRAPWPGWRTAATRRRSTPRCAGPGSPGEQATAPGSDSVGYA